MQEREACAVLKAAFEGAGFKIAENVPFVELGVEFEIDGYDAERHVGYEYVTDEAGDSWDVDSDVVTALAAGMTRGEAFVLIVDEGEAADRAALTTRVETFFGELRAHGVLPGGEAPAKAKKKATAAKSKAPAKRKKPS